MFYPGQLFGEQVSAGGTLTYSVDAGGDVFIIRTISWNHGSGFDDPGFISFGGVMSMMLKGSAPDPSNAGDTIQCYIPVPPAYHIELFAPSTTDLFVTAWGDWWTPGELED